MLDREDSTLLINLVAAAEMPRPEATFLTLLAARMRADGGQMFVGGTVWTLGASDPVPMALPDVMSGLRLNRVYTADELPAGTQDDLRALGVSQQDGRAAWLVLTRARGLFRAIDTARLTAYAPHLQQVLGMAGRFAVIAARERVQALAARRMGVGLVHWTSPSTVPMLDQVAHDLLATHQLTLADMVRLWPRGKITDCQIIRLAPTLDMLVLPVTGASGQTGLMRARNLPLPAAAIIASALGISLAEARLARTLADGSNLSEAAMDLGLTLQTARFYSKQIFAKTGLSGQPALMRRIWTSALAMAR